MYSMIIYFSLIFTDFAYFLLSAILSFISPKVRNPMTFSAKITNESMRLAIVLIYMRDYMYLS